MHVSRMCDKNVTTKRFGIFGDLCFFPAGGSSYQYTILCFLDGASKVSFCEYKLKKVAHSHFKLQIFAPHVSNMKTLKPKNLSETQPWDYSSFSRI